MTLFPKDNGEDHQPKDNGEDHQTGASDQRPGSKPEEKRVEEESAQFPAPHPAYLASQVPTEIQGSKLQPGQEREQVSALVELAESQLAAGEAQRAMALLERAVGGNSRDLHLPLLLGKAREALGDDKGAVDAYLTAVERGAWGPEVEAALLRDDFLLKTYPYSAEVLLKLTARRESVPLWRRLARLCETRGDYEKATSLLTEAVRVKPDDVASLSILARLSERRQELEEGAEWHRRILEIHPDLRASLLFLAQRHYAQGEYGQAIPYFERLLFQERGDRSGELYWLLSNVKGYGVQGLEERIGEVLQWRDLKAEEQPLVQELLVLAGKDGLERENLERAEQYLAQAYQFAPSPEVGRLLAEVESKKGERAQREGHLLHACVHYQLAAEYDPGNPTYAQQVALAVALRASERKRRHWKKYERIGLGAALVLLLVGGVLGVRQVRERQRAPSAEENGPTMASQGRAIAVEGKAASLPVSESTDSPEMPTVSEADSSATGEGRLPESGEGRQREAGREKESPEVTNQSRVETAMALGMQVSGTGRGDPARSLAAIQEGVEKHLADLQAVYERERATTPILMGSLVLNLTIEANGRTSQARLQSAKLPSTRLQERVLTLARTWQFSTAAGRVYVFYPLLFLPPGVDTASVIAWERGTAAVRSNAPTPTSVLPSGSEQSPTRVPSEQEGARRRVRSGNTPALSNDAGNSQAATEPVREEAPQAPPGSGQRFVHPELGYSITPPPGFTLLQTGRRTIWQGPEGTQLLVETSSSPGRSARAGWEQSHADLAKKYGPRYRSYGITETQLAGRPAAAWEFLLITAVGKRQKLDVAVLDRGVGYGILVSAPAERFSSWRPQFEATLRSFRLPLG